jgi:hypothetical protein
MVLVTVLLGVPVSVNEGVPVEFAVLTALAVNVGTWDCIAVTVNVALSTIVFVLLGTAYTEAVAVAV